VPGCLPGLHPILLYRFRTRMTAGARTSPSLQALLIRADNLRRQ
jgi:hypothetical protein